MGFRLERGDAALIFPNQFHHYIDVEEGNLDWLFITFECGVRSPIEKLMDHPRRLNAKALALLETVLNMYLGSSRAGDHDQIDSIGISHKLASLLRLMVSLPEIPEKTRNIHLSEDNRDQLLEKINAYVRDHIYGSSRILVETECGSKGKGPHAQPAHLQPSRLTVSLSMTEEVGVDGQRPENIPAWPGGPRSGPEGQERGGYC